MFESIFVAVSVGERKKLDLDRIAPTIVACIVADDFGARLPIADVYSQGVTSTRLFHFCFCEWNVPL